MRARAAAAIDSREFAHRLSRMNATFAIEQMTLHEKLQAMELLWDQLRQCEEQIPVPQWHKDLLDERLKLVAAGKASFSDWEEAKQRILARTA